MDPNLEQLIAQYQKMVAAGAPPEQTEPLKAEIMRQHGGDTQVPGTADQDVKARMATGLGSLNTSESDSMKKVIGLMSGQISSKPEPKPGAAELEEPQVTGGEKKRKKKPEDDEADQPADINGRY